MQFVLTLVLATTAGEAAFVAMPLSTRVACLQLTPSHVRIHAAALGFEPLRYIFSATVPTSGAAITFGLLSCVAWYLPFFQPSPVATFIEKAITALRKLLGKSALSGTDAIVTGYTNAAFLLCYFFFFVAGSARAAEAGYGVQFLFLGTALELLVILCVGVRYKAG